MMFRRLYWVTEQLDEQGCSTVTGVYTSIPDLVRHGLRYVNDLPQGGFRLNLVKLDCTKKPLGIWESPRFEGLADRLSEYVATDEFSQDQCNMLVEALSHFSGVKA
ncbi:MAG TPA: hypothetical protein VM328_08015 [Fimbriimonadaceae bacterium]|nr:hypothetical protein [Fimbriimonadaceae bacterium]